MIIQKFISDKESYLNFIKKDWLACPDSFPDFLSEITKANKQENEQYIEKITSSLQKQLKSYKKLPIARKIWRKKTWNLINDFLYHEDILSLHDYMTPAELDAFCEELKIFMRKARQFAPELSFADIGQAIRNYIVYAMFKKLHRIDTGFNLAGFGYSMLYPFTDNYIDNQSLSAREKDAYNQLIRDKIQGKTVCPQTIHQTKTCQLLQYIEDCYPKNKDSYVYSLLLMMLDAQEISIRQQNSSQMLSESERLDISVYKGGISVLIDRYLVNKELTEPDLIFYLGFGFFLQLADDLQDIKEDSSLGHSNLFTVDLHYPPQEKLVNKILHYVHKITEAFPADDNHMKQFLLTNCYQLIYSSVMQSKEFFSPNYILQIEKYLPVSASYLDNMTNHRIENRDFTVQEQYITLLDELI